MDCFQPRPLHIIFEWAQVLRVIVSKLGIQEPKNGEWNDYWSRAMLLSSNHSPIFLGLKAVSKMPLEGRVFCRGGTCCSSKCRRWQCKSEMHGRIASFTTSASCRGKRTRVWHLEDTIGPFCLKHRPTLLAPIGVQVVKFYTIASPSLVHQKYSLGWHTES
ncbi:hypothetical protein TNCV_1719961 [Trichonephila clavipes]|nr:hypothetical protein TNCV_1719961 [Trichonephila clavipes]